MRARLICLILTVTLGAGCARTAVATGAVAVLYGGAVLVDEPSSRGGGWPDARPFLGFALVAGGLVTMAVGGLAIAWEPPAPPPAALRATGAVSPSGDAEATTAEPAGPARAPGASGDLRLTQLALYARAGDCDTVVVVARALARTDAAPVLAVVRRDTYVARCLASRR